MATDLVERCIEAIVTIVNADSGMQALTGRTTRNLVPWGDIASLEANDLVPRLPVCAYAVIDASERGGIGDTRDIRLQITAYAAGDNAQAKANAMLERIELGITQPLLFAQSIDAAPIRRTRRGITEEAPEGIRNLRRADVDLDLYVTK